MAPPSARRSVIGGFPSGPAFAIVPAMRAEKWIGIGLVAFGCAAAPPRLKKEEPSFSVACVPTPGGGHHVALLHGGVEVAGLGDCAALQGKSASDIGTWVAAAKVARAECIGTVSHDCGDRLSPGAAVAAVTECYRDGIATCESSYETAHNLLAGR